MKANELMVGDWVRVVPYKKNGRIYRIDYTNGKGNEYVGVIDGDFDIGLLEPIPITPEILEKNGFAKEKEDELAITYYFLERPYTTQITLYKEPICDVSILFKAWGRVPSFAGGVNDIHLCSVKYVHEMQHALRLCGIDKEIEL